MTNPAITMEDSKQIWAILPDDEKLIHGVIHALKDEKKILTAHQIVCRGIGAVGRPGRGFRANVRPKGLRLLTVVVAADRREAPGGLRAQRRRQGQAAQGACSRSRRSRQRASLATHGSSSRLLGCSGPPSALPREGSMLHVPPPAEASMRRRHGRRLRCV